jgi:Mrp family chromosome partitioning ATPase
MHAEPMKPAVNVDLAETSGCRMDNVTLTISGPPGVGKTTIAHALVAFFQNLGVAVELSDIDNLDPAEVSHERHQQVLQTLAAEGALKPRLRIETEQTPRPPRELFSRF